ncbi:MAG: GNAT family N-acetyltransferase [Bacteroidetes bacterium]|nr:GNAT family N-acetyltransferase [Bacteroidota bacterium]
MIILEQYGVRLVRLRENDIELVRYWRNKSDIANFMEYRRYITPYEQLAWFKSINNKLNYYFIIEYEGKKVGLINSKNYDPALGFSEGGIFIWDKSYIDSYVAIYSTLCFLNFIFHVLKISKTSMARILRTNTRAIQYNKQIGYRLLPGQENVENQLYELTEEDYLEKGGKLNKAAALLNPGYETLRYSGVICPENLDEVNRLLEAIK